VPLFLLRRNTIFRFCALIYGRYDIIKGMGCCMKMEDIILVQKDLQDKMNQGKKESQKLESPEAKAIYEEMCDCFDKLVMLTKRYKAEGR